MAIEVLMGAARLDDMAGIENFLRDLPNGEALRDKLKPGQKHRIEHYDKPNQTARYLLIDGVWFVCFVVIGVSLDDAQKIARQTDLLVDWTTPNFHAAVERALYVGYPKAN
jgi:hypothetical protein